MELNKMFDYLEEMEIATGEEIQLVTDINGWSEETVNDILFARTGYRDLEQYTEYEDKDTYNEYFKEEEEEEE